jgi:antirestriction protein ArdC
MIEGGLLPWRCRWSEVRPSKSRHRKPRLVPIGRPSLPISISSHKPYRGVNVLILWASSIRRGFGSPYWGTLNAWNGVDCRVKKGERATRIVRWVEKTETDPVSGDVVDEGFFPVVHSVFNAAQVEGPPEVLAKYRADAPAPVLVPEGEPEPMPEPMSCDWEPAERLVRALRPRIKWGGAEASYNYKSNTILMPDRDRFHTEAGRYSVLMHEMGHWTGHRERLARDLTGNHADPAYWTEELVAELASCFVLAELDLPDRLEELPGSGAYLKHYLDLLKGDRRAFVKAAGLAQKAADHILGGGNIAAAPVGRTRKPREVEERRAKEESRP